MTNFKIGKKAFVLSALVALSLGIITFNPTHAAPAIVEIGPGIGCTLFDGDGSVAFAPDAQGVVTQSNNGNIKLTCHAENVPNNQGKAVRYDSNNNPFGPGQPCVYQGEATLNWKEVVSDNGDGTGDATLVCHFKTA
ncbi:MAG: hypothetical protein ACT4N5_05735 [Nitrosopumilaceae archaeon]